jgi:hypothetical protein
LLGVVEPPEPLSLVEPLLVDSVDFEVDDLVTRAGVVRPPVDAGLALLGR